MAMTNYYNRAEVKDKQWMLRSAQTKIEGILWDCLRDCQVSGLKFRRHYSAGVYIVDFYCPACRLAVESDSESHTSLEAQEYDAERTEFLATLNIRVVRFTNVVVQNDIQTVPRQIADASASS